MNAADEILGPSLGSGRGESLAIICGGQTLTYDQLNRLACRYGNAMLAAGAKRQQPVLLLLDDGPELVAAYLGAMKAGLVAVALNTRLAAKDLSHALGDSGAPLLLAEETLKDLAAESLALARAPARLVTSDSFNAFLEGASDQLASADMNAEDSALWMYTSGTTGQPKGAVHVHGSIPMGERHVRENLGLLPGDRIFSTSKLFFAYPLGHCLIGALRCGGTLVLHRGWPDAAAAAEVIERTRPKVVLSVPSLYRIMLKDGLASSEAFRGVRTWVSAGENLPAELCRRWMEETGGLMLEGIGATEALFLFIASTPAAMKPGACGRPLPWAEAQLRTPAGEVITAPDTPGDLWVRMDSLFRRYHNRPDVTQRVLKDGWWKTGDVFSMDSEGWWSPQGRSDDMIKVSGQWVSPAEVEEAALMVPGVADAVAVGIPNEDGLVRLVLYAVAEPGEHEPILETRIVESLRAKLAIFKCPRNVRFLETIPRTATGKVQRFKLREAGA
ncbi:Acyl-coenzyme A synthetase/AMP-(fatty) acid ligase [Paramagnetospirillum caucaseum]|uniref:Acyl-coenzyme A synthetase/AMP-(Fatty) acid ligase n=1 Tax=Paramagnetospirillum caucaseum TaxID=1244869 RepID=M3A6Z5_9PROT|nr:AMP-binding protein [Paramagnetospirillum caucaseum]EME68259.1 Acyl-coenzyme A synthetase/AMP-(fatty) acid ligase [Paramagnetospirillum caucaseum]